MFKVYNKISKLNTKLSNDKRKSPKTLRKSKALLIGINYKGTSSELHGCINDVKNVEKVLKKQNYTEIFMMTDDTETKPTFENIIKGIKWLVEDSEQYETLFLHYSGHGSNVKDTDGDEADHRDECLCSLDSKSITDDMLFDILVSKVKTDLTCVIDACHSGSMLDLQFNIKLAPKKIRMNKYNMDAWQSNEKIVRGPKTLDHNHNIIMISGCQDNEYSADSFFENEARGALTHTFLEVYKYNKNITCKELLKQIHVKLELNNYKQNPVFSTNDLRNYVKPFDF